MTPDAPFPLEGGRAGDGGATAQRPRSRPATRSVKRARRFRKTPTLAERLQWEALRKKQLNYRRQVPIGRYIIDLAHHASKLLIEIDGYHHTTDEGLARDESRDAWLISEGFRVLRIPEKAVRDNLHQVVDQIVAETLSPPSPTLPPSRGKGECAP